MKRFNQIFFRGLITLLPAVATLYIAIWLILLLDGALSHVLKQILPEQFIFPGLGLFTTAVLIFLFGLATENFSFNKMILFFEKRFKDLPLIKVIYGPLKDLIKLFSNADKKQMKSVVLVNVTPTIQLIGLVTRESFEDVPVDATNKVVVYLPLSYMLGGMSLLVPRSQLTELDIPVEKAMKLAITGWVKTSDQSHDSPF